MLVFSVDKVQLEKYQNQIFLFRNCELGNSFIHYWSQKSKKLTPAKTVRVEMKIDCEHEFNMISMRKTKKFLKY